MSGAVAVPTDIREPQYMAALDRANYHRFERAAIKRDIAAGRCEVSELIEHPPDCLLTMRIGDLMQCVWRMGGKRTRKLLAEIPVSPNKTIGSMTERQRKIVAKYAPEARIPPSPKATTRSDLAGGTPPQRTHQQRSEALNRANEVQVKRAKLKQEIKRGNKSIHALLLDPPDFTDTMKVYELILAAPKYGRVKVNKIIAHARISPSKTIGGLSERQRAELIGLLLR